MKSILKVLVISPAFLMSSFVAALEMPAMGDLYYHVQYSLLDVEISNQNGSGSAETAAVILEVGKKVYSHQAANIFVEGVAMLGLDEKVAFSYNNGANRYQGGIDGVIGIQAKAVRQFNPKFSGFFNLGLMNVTASVNSEGCLLSECASDVPIEYKTTNSISFGLGGGYQISKSSAVTLSYMNLFSDDVGNSDVDVTGINFGYKRKFK